MLKSNKGVTLVALVITIIVLLILAGVSISLVVGDNGVLNNATKAVDETSAAQAQESVGMAVSSAQTDYFVAYVDDQNLDFDDDWYDSDDDGVADDDGYAAVEAYLKKTDGVDSYSIANGSSSVVYNGTTYTFTLELNSTSSGLVVSDFAESDS